MARFPVLVCLVALVAMLATGHPSRPTGRDAMAAKTVHETTLVMAPAATGVTL